MPRRGKRKKRSELKETLILLILSLKGPVGRYRLKDMLGLSEHEGVVKLMLKELKSSEFIRSGAQGATLTRKGEMLLKKRLDKLGIAVIRDLDLKDLETGPYTVVAHLPKKASLFDSVLRYRDEAIRAGALGTTIITYKEGVLSVPMVYSNLLEVFPSAAEKLLETFNLQDGDALLVVSGVDRWKAMEGALAVASFSE